MADGERLAVLLRRRAYVALGWAITAGDIPHPSSQPCAVCERPARSWHHHLGYEREHWLDVVALCARCHRDEHTRSRLEQRSAVRPEVPRPSAQPVPDPPVPDPVMETPRPTPYDGPSSASTALGRPLPPWPWELPLVDAAALFGEKADTVSKRVRRGTQPGYRLNGRAFVILLPAQWARWAPTYQPPAPGATRRSRPAPSIVADASPWDRETVDRLREELEALRVGQQRLVAQLGYWQGRAAAAEEQVQSLLARPADPPDRPPSWWRRFLVSIGILVAPEATPAPPPQT